jgi:hypothetical protein
MLDYELFYEELRYYNLSRRWQTHVSTSVLIEDVADDQAAISAAKIIIKATSNDPLVVKRVPVKLARLIPVDSWE